MPSRSRMPTVCPYSRAVMKTSSPRASRRSMIGRRTKGCAAAVQSTQIFIAGDPNEARAPGSAGGFWFGFLPRRAEVREFAQRVEPERSAERDGDDRQQPAENVR